MKKRFFKLGAIALTMSSAALNLNAQVGINNESPKATLDVVASKIDGSKAEGIIAPRLSLLNLNSAETKGAYTAAQKGTLVYVTDASTGVQTGQTVNVNETGYYYFDGAVWVKLITSVPVNKFLYGGGSPVGIITCPGTASTNTIYVDTLYGSPTRGLEWICDGTMWHTYNPPPSTEWMFAGSTNDAGGNKDQAIWRNAPVAIGTSLPITGRAVNFCICISSLKLLFLQKKFKL